MIWRIGFHYLGYDVIRQFVSLGENHWYIKISWEVVVAQLVERSLPISEVRGSNPVIGKNLYGTFTVNCIWKNENKVKQAGNGPFKKTIFQYAIILTRLWRMKQFKSVLKWHKVDHSDIRWVKDGMQIALPTQEKTRSF